MLVRVCSDDDRDLTCERGHFPETPQGGLLLISNACRVIVVIYAITDLDNYGVLPPCAHPIIVPSFLRLPVGYIKH